MRELFVMRSDGRFLRRVARLPQPVSAPTWSPDGRRIAFAPGSGSRRGISVINTNGRGLRRVVTGAAGARALDWQPRGGADPVIAAAGDIACDPGSGRFDTGLGTRVNCHMLQISNVMMNMELSAILPLGDVQYEDGTLDKFLRSFEPTWGRLKGIMRPVVGNHEYRVPGAQGYFDYFNGIGQANGPAGPTGLGYYSYDIGSWHLIALNSQCSHPPAAPQQADCAPGSAQEQWLRADLASHPARCTLAYWHHPLYSSGIAGFNSAVQPLFRALYEAGADVVLTGHDHSYERFAPVDPDVNRDGARGLRQFVVGTGGKNHEPRNRGAPHSEVRNSGDFGVLALTLRPNGYSWRFAGEPGSDFAEQGANDCH